MGHAWYDKRCKQSLTVSTLIRSVNDTEIELAEIA